MPRGTGESEGNSESEAEKQPGEKALPSRARCYAAMVFKVLAKCPRETQPEAPSPSSETKRRSEGMSSTDPALHPTTSAPRLWGTDSASCRSV